MQPMTPERNERDNQMGWVSYELYPVNIHFPCSQTIERITRLGITESHFYTLSKHISPTADQNNRFSEDAYGRKESPRTELTGNSRREVDDPTKIACTNTSKFSGLAALSP
ncbi:hypothetical protein E2C01_028336 [Portunus trituberculatus]|uniref:Uncharacterized protein n=1 Tax=Portunus trituberculatus TaxID=210409 RepID=A0A5B7EL36_PORTR|nr:hypothetical protein [Portunus trituberculatus]